MGGKEVARGLPNSSCGARFFANRERGNRHIALCIVKEWFKGALAVFATEFSPRGEEWQEEEQEKNERVQVAPNMGAGGSYPS